MPVDYCVHARLADILVRNHMFRLQLNKPKQANSAAEKEYLSMN